LSVSSLWDAEQERQIALAMVGFAQRTRPIEDDMFDQTAPVEAKDQAHG